MSEHISFCYTFTTQFSIIFHLMLAIEWMLPTLIVKKHVKILMAPSGLPLICQLKMSCHNTVILFFLNEHVKQLFSSRCVIFEKSKNISLVKGEQREGRWEISVFMFHFLCLLCLFLIKYFCLFFFFSLRTVNILYEKIYTKKYLQNF